MIPACACGFLPGLKQTAPPDVMRGEETQIAGFLAAAPGFDGVLCMPGTHAKWVQISAEEVVSFRTFMTGELFDLLAGHSVLRHSVAGEGTDDDAFRGGRIRDAVETGDAGAKAVLDPRGPVAGGVERADGAGAAFGGYLIGAELSAARPYWLGQDVVIAGAPALVHSYAMALATQGVTARTSDADPLTRLGLMRARSTLKESAS